MPARKSASDYMAESGHKWVVESSVPLQTAVAVCMDCSVTAVTNPAKIYSMMARKHREAARRAETQTRHNDGCTCVNCPGGMTEMEWAAG